MSKISFKFPKGLWVKIACQTISPNLLKKLHALTTFLHQCLKLMVAQSPLAIEHWDGQVKFDPGQVKIIIDYIKGEIFLHFWATKTKRKFYFETLLHVSCVWRNNKKYKFMFHEINSRQQGLKQCCVQYVDLTFLLKTSWLVHMTRFADSTVNILVCQ